jgi:hypothetical protein
MRLPKSHKVQLGYQKKEKPTLKNKEEILKNLHLAYRNMTKCMNLSDLPKINKSLSTIRYYIESLSLDLVLGYDKEPKDA